MKFYEFLNNFQYTNDGIGKNTSITDIDKKQLLVGIAVEAEHGRDLNFRASHAIDHLTENKKYYTILMNSGLVDEEKAIFLAKKFNMIPEDSAQFNAATDAEENDDDDLEMTDRLLGYEPKNVGDEIEGDEEIEEPKEEVPEPEEKPEEKNVPEDIMGENKKTENNLITEELIKKAKLTLSNRNISTGLTKKEATKILMKNNLKFL